MASAFSRFPPRLQEAIASRLGWTTLRPVQDLAGHAILDGKNAVVLAPTAGGKTEASVFPVLARLMEEPARGVGALYIAPIRALLNNQEDRLGQYTEMVGLRRFVWHGDTRQAAKRDFLREPVDLLMTTPESLEVMLLSPKVPAEALFADLRAVIIDEVHAFAGTDRGAHLMAVLERIADMAQGDVQRIGLSATVGNPEAILRWLAGSSRRGGVVVDPPKQPRKRQIRVALTPMLPDLAAEASVQAAGRKSLFFCQSRALAEQVADRMRGRGTDVFVHHSSVAFEERAAAEERFHHGTNACIVCTSTLELGIDVGDLDLVLQANAPATVSSFLQRMGRTGRRDGQDANTTFYCETAHAALQAVAIVELARQGWVEAVPVQRRAWPVMVHQVLAQTLQHGAVSADRCWSMVSRVPDFAGIGRAEYDSLVAHMLREGFLFEAGGLLSMGERAERVFGRKNFMEIYAVFSSPVLYRVKTHSGRDLGSVEQAFVDRLVEGMTSFLLAGRAWLVEHINHADKVVRVHEAPKGRKPTWGGFLPQFLGFDLCQRMRGILTETVAYPYADAVTQEVIEEWRADLGDLLRASALGVRRDDDGLALWTFAGGLINGSLRLALKAGWGIEVSADNLRLRVNDESQADEVLGALKMLADPAWWRAADNVAGLQAQCPDYRLSKFQPALPSELAAELVAGYLVDGQATAAFLRSANCG
ncbi:MAG: DEAD/DEAH box helicase [Rhodospirillaceae bacterium BRH_c57]|nr:MAG: DEAD/DEAH box helicase [Rhodospirillaceae bacterium BRH_c57]